MDIWAFAVDMTASMRQAWELENPAIQEQDIRNSVRQPDEDEVSDPPESIPESTGDSNEY